jgi:uncharacterized protein (TIGR03435 family)
MTMTRASACVSIIAFCAIALAQTAEKPPAFDLADVHPSAHVINPYMRGGVLRGGRYDVRTATMVDLIAAAYSVDNEKVQGGPSWLDTDRFDISAKAPTKTPPETVKLMLQTLLADRFALKVHSDSKSLPVYALTLGKGKPKLRESGGSAPSRCQFVPQNTAPSPIQSMAFSCQNRTMEQFAHDLHDFAGDYLSNPVVDQTGLKGNWDFEIKWMFRGARAPATAAGTEHISVFDAVDKQLGLKLEASKLPLPVVIVDSANQKPTANPPGVDATLPPPPPAEFEVATIKPSSPDAKGQRGRLEHGRINVENFPIKTLIMIAWDLNANELIVGAPKFVDSARFDIAAKAQVPAQGPEVDFEDLRLMLRALLIERFDLKTHMEERPVEGYVLEAAKPKMRKADPTDRTGCKEGPGPDGKDPRIQYPILSRLITCQNMTMSQFADQLPNLANGYAHVTVLDQTGLTDAYDFTLSFSAVQLLRGNGLPGQQAQAPPQPGGQPAASDPSGALSLSEAVSKQLGLKLELKKRLMQVLVIDHISEKPTEN